MFEVIGQRSDKHIVIPDVHGEFKLLLRLIDQTYNQEDVCYVFMGDVIDRKGMDEDLDQGVRQTLDILKGLEDRAVLTLANHELYLMASALSRDYQDRQLFSSFWTGRHDTQDRTKSSLERNTISSYDLTNDGTGAVTRLWREMKALGHDRVLTSATPYYETDKFIAIHAGLEYGKPWEQQREYLEMVAEKMALGIFDEEPAQWFSLPLAVDAKPNDATTKTVVSGHAHYLISKKSDSLLAGVQAVSPDRVLDDGRRVRLASQVNGPEREDLYVWQDWDKKIIRVEQ